MKQQKGRPQERKGKTDKKIPRTQKDWEKHYEEAAAFYESEGSLEAMAKGTPITSAKLRALSNSKAKLISLRMPLLTLAGAKRIALKRDLPYQRLIIQAVERLIDEEEKQEQEKLKSTG